MRTKNVLDMLLAQARRKLDEIKELQFFGGDALNLKRKTIDITIPADMRAHCWRIVMTPENRATTMPISIVVKSRRSDQTRTYSTVERVKRSDGNFEYLVMYIENFIGTPWQDVVAITYSGKANFMVTQIA